MTMENGVKDPAEVLTDNKKRKAVSLSFLTRTTIFESFQVPDFGWFWLGTFANFMAIGMQMMARGWLVLRLSNDSPLALSMVMVAFALPMTVMSLLGGALADRFSKKHIIMTTQTVNALITALLATLDLTDLIRFWHLIAIGVVNGSMMAVNVPSRQAIIADMVPQEKLMNAISLTNSGMNLTRAIGPALAGILIIYIDTAGVFYLVSAFSVFAMLSIGMIGTTKRVTDRARKSMIQDISAGLKYVFSDPTLRGLCITLCVPVFFGFTIIFLLPAWAREAMDVQADDLGLLMFIMGMGSLLGSLTLAALRSVSKRGTWVLVNGLLWGVCIIIFSKNDSYATVLPFIFLIGFMSATFLSLHMTLMQTYSTEEMRGRVMSIGTMSFGAMPLSVLPFGAIAEKIGTPNALLLSGLMMAVFVLVFALSSPKFFRIE